MPLRRYFWLNQNHTEQAVLCEFQTNDCNESVIFTESKTYKQSDLQNQKYTAQPV